MSRKNREGPDNYAFFEPALEGFAGEHDIELQVFGDQRLHWRLAGISAVLDCWPTTGKYWVKDTPLNGFMTNHGRTGKLPHNYTELDMFLSQLFGVEKS